MAKDKSLPTFSVDLIKQLDEYYPERCPEITLNEREIWFYAGARSVVRNLLSRLEEAEENNLLLESDDVNVFR